MHNKPGFLRSVLTIVLTVTSTAALTQTFPNRPITMVVPFPAGGSTDIIARILGDHAQRTLGQPIVIENVSGAGGTIGVARVVRALPDGYTLSVGDMTSHMSSSAIIPVQYDVLADLQPISLLSTGPQLLLGRRTLEPNTLQELIAWLKAKPGKASAALPGTVGSGGHLSGLSFQKLTGTSFAFVPYRGGAPAVADLIAGHVDLLFTDASNALPFVRSGDLKTYGVSSRTRWSGAPDIPTLAEQGVPVYFTLWRGLWAPKNTPPDRVATLNSAVRRALSDPAIKKKIGDAGQDVASTDQLAPEAFGRFHRSEAERWWPIINAAGIKAQ